MSAMDSDGVRVITHQVRRLEVPVAAGFEDFRGRYELAAPVWDVAGFARLAEAGAGWNAVTEAAAANAPHGFIRYWGADIESTMRLSGRSRPCVEYLMGNHIYAQRMYRHNPGVMLYAPLRTAIHVDYDDRTWFTVDQPSTRFGSFSDERIAAVGIELDAKLAALIDHLGLPVPADLVAESDPNRRSQ
ncbi:hypothetical protein [Kutzneria kofuensis]|uniref:DUF302 domain-containing protein n=1 Tax=Kutzneria kofuensis TaxID=103725 RepID=A0A7W9KPP1_9PSEU|nr:hypothetical protein [Kutzneria kofuensis]MBB5896431.1 hypothetical protein [Kutzneria kofuensis]